MSLARLIATWFLALFGKLWARGELPETKDLPEATGPTPTWFVITHRAGKAVKVRPVTDPDEVEIELAAAIQDSPGAGITLVQPDGQAGRLNGKARRAVLARVQRRMVREAMAERRKAGIGRPVRKAPRLSFAGRLLREARLAKVGQ